MNWDKNDCNTQQILKQPKRHVQAQIEESKHQSKSMKRLTTSPYFKAYEETNESPISIYEPKTFIITPENIQLRQTCIQAFKICTKQGKSPSKAKKSVADSPRSKKRRKVSVPKTI
ncbi:hypothetical protein Droror1_Dr00008043 [Drosera rotundifolia]